MFYSICFCHLHLTSSENNVYAFQVLFCSTEVGRTSFVRQLESDFHIDTNLDIVSQLSVCYLVSYLFLVFWSRGFFWYTYVNIFPPFIISGSFDANYLFPRWKENSLQATYSILQVLSSSSLEGGAQRKGFCTPNRCADLAAQLWVATPPSQGMDETATVLL